MSITCESQTGTVIFLLKRVDCNDGVASHLETLIIGLKAKGWRIILLTGHIYEKKDAEERYNSIKNSVSKWIVVEGFGNIRHSMSIILRLLAVVKEFDASVVHAHGLSLLPYTAILRMLSGKKIIASYLPSTHSANPKNLKIENSKFEVLQYMAVLTLFRPNYVIAFSAEVYRFFSISCGLPARNLCKIVLGIDSDHFRPPNPTERQLARAKLGLEANEIVVVLPGRPNWNKGHDLVISAAKSLARSHPNAVIRYIMPGTGYQAETVMRVAAESSDDNRRFIFPGFVADMRQVYIAADIAVLPSRVEAFPLVVAEAMACGLPVIRTPSGGFEDQIVDGVNGFGVPFNDDKALAGKISVLLDVSVRHRMGLAALEHSKKFDSKIMIAETEALYLGLMPGRPI